MNVYVYQAALYCEDCGEDIKRHLTDQGKAPADQSNEHTYDSDDFPKGPYPDGGGESDTVQHCDSGAHCRNRIRISYTTANGKRKRDYIGAWLENDLTADGARYVREAIAENPRGAVTRLWRRWYADTLAWSD